MKMAEVLGEFDKEYPPSPFSFCRRISLADYDREGSEETHVELEKLLDFIEHNPKVYYNVIRKRKRDELNLFPFVKVKLMSAIQGEDYLQSYFPEDDCKKQLEGWKDDLVASYDFGQEAAGNGKRFSKRLAAKNKDKEAKKLEMTSTAPAVPPVPPPLPPPLPPPVLPPQSRMVFQ